MTSRRAPRNTIDRDRIVIGARALLDQRGLGALTMRALADELGVRPMALYHHVATKDELLDLLVDRVFAGVYVPLPDGDWRHELAERSRSLRSALSSHPWALSVMESRKRPGASSLRQHEAVLATMRGSGFSVPAAAHGYALLDAFVYGFALQEVMLGDAGLRDDPQELAAGIDFSASPHVAEVAQMHLSANADLFSPSFDVGLTAVLDGLASIAEDFRDPSEGESFFVTPDSPGPIRR